jgi:hypothetical protein
LGSDAFGKQKEKTTLIQFTSSGCLVEPWDGKKEKVLGGEEAEDPELGQPGLQEGHLCCLHKKGLGLPHERNVDR